MTSTATLSTAISRWTPRVGQSKSAIVKNWKAIAVHICLWLVLSIVLVAGLVGGYCLFYNWYVPAERVSQLLYFDYTADHPVASASLDLQKGLAYDISLKLLVPDMAGLSESLGPIVFTSRFQGGSDIISSVRPMLVVYRSWPVRMALLGLRLIPVVLGVAHEATPHRVFLLERLVPRGGAPTALRVEMTGRLPTYEVTLDAVAHFGGLRYLMYYWKYTFAGLLIGGASLASLLVLSTVLGLSLYSYISEQRQDRHQLLSDGRSETSTKSSALSTKSTNASGMSSKLRESNFALRQGWGLGSLRRRFHTTEELRVPNGHPPFDGDHSGGEGSEPEPESESESGRQAQ